MKVTYTAGRITFEADLKSRAEAFEWVSKIMEIFTGEPCGLCGCKDTHPTVRHAKGYAFYEMVCEAPSCGAKLGYFKKDDMFFASRQNKERQWLPNKGWSKYVPQGQANGGQHPDLPANESSADTGGEVPF